MDWTDCLTVDLSPDEGPALLPTPTYPFFCTAAHHVIEHGTQSDEGLTVADFSQNGPHFFDWEDLHEQVQIPSQICMAFASPQFADCFLIMQLHLHSLSW